MDWEHIRSRIRLLKDWSRKTIHDARKRSALAVYVYAKSYEEELESIKHTLEEIAPSELIALRDKEFPAVRMLTDEEVKSLWGEFSKKLKEAGIKPEEHRSDFERVLLRNMSYDENLYMLMGEAKLIKLAKKYPQLSRKGWATLQEALKRANKIVDWESIDKALGTIAYLILILEDSAKAEDARHAYRIAIDMKELLRSVIDHIEMMIPGITEILKTARG
jgi:hypothetical protein